MASSKLAIEPQIESMWKLGGLTLWFASGGMSSMISTLNAIYHAQESRSWFRVRIVALGLTIAMDGLGCLLGH